MSHISRRLFGIGAASTAAAGLSACSSSSRGIPFAGTLFDEPSPGGSRASLGRSDYGAIYASYPGEQYPVPAFRFNQVDPIFLRQTVAYDGPAPPGTIVVAPAERHLYFIEPGRRATRYGVGVGRDGFAWSGDARINMRRSWPDWVPPQEMVARDPDIRSQLVSTPRGQGVPGGPHNPLGARAMYLFAKGGDTGYRIHGTTEPETIGTNVSSGCIRMVNQDVIHLYGRAPDGTKVLVLPT